MRFHPVLLHLVYRSRLPANKALDGFVFRSKGHEIKLFRTNHMDENNVVDADGEEVIAPVEGEEAVTEAPAEEAAPEAGEEEAA